MVYIAKSKSNWNYESFLTYGQFKNNSSRISDGNTASYNNSAYGARFRVSRVLNGIQAKGQLAAYIDLHYLQLTQDAYKESGTNINVDAANMNLLQLPVGLIWSRTYKQKSGVAITPELGAAYVFNLGNRYADLQCYTEASTVPEHVYSQNFGGGTAKLSMGIRTTFSRTLDMSLKYDREI